MRTEVKQRHRFDCVPAVAAMITGRPIEEFDQFFAEFTSLVASLNTKLQAGYFKAPTEAQPGHTLLDLKLYLLAVGFSTGLMLEVEPGLQALTVLGDGQTTVEVCGPLNLPAILLDYEHRHMGFWTGDTFFDPGRTGNEFILNKIIPIHDTNK